jgi:hypothetical protein
MVQKLGSAPLPSDHTVADVSPTACWLMIPDLSQIEAIYFTSYCNETIPLL